MPIIELEVLADEAGQRSLDRLSGTPYGLPTKAWPKCFSCKAPMSFIAQLAHDETRFDLGGDGRVAFVFICLRLDTRCGFSAGVPYNDQGAQAVLVERAKGGAAAAPEALPSPPAPSIVITGWTEREEPVDPRIEDHLIFGLHRDRPDWPRDVPEVEHEDAHRRALGRTKIGGEPRWLQDPWFQDHGDANASKRTRYVAQLADHVVLARKRKDIPLKDNRLMGSGDVTSCFTTLGTGRLYLLQDTVTKDFVPYYIGR